MFPPQVWLSGQGGRKGGVWVHRVLQGSASARLCHGLKAGSCPSLCTRVLSWCWQACAMLLYQKKDINSVLLIINVHHEWTFAPRLQLGLNTGGEASWWSCYPSTGMQTAGESLPSLSPFTGKHFFPHSKRWSLGTGLREVNPPWPSWNRRRNGAVPIGQPGMLRST